MEFNELIATRQSVRVFKQQEISEDMHTRILEAAQCAPSAGNLQAFKVYSVMDEKLKQSLAFAALGQNFINDAALVLVFCADSGQSAQRYGQRGESLYAIQDATIACTFAMLAATNLGLGSVWVGAFDETAVSRALNIPETLRPVALLPIGYAGEEPEKRTRRSLAELVHSVD